MVRRPSHATPALPAHGRRRPLIAKEPPKRLSPLAEVAGATAAGCAALCCCCPCGPVHLLLLLVLKLPARLVRRAVRRRRKRRARGARAKAGLWRREGGAFRDDSDLSLYHGMLLARSSTEETWPANSPSPELAELDKEMLANFYGAGFWRSLSQRE